MPRYQAFIEDYFLIDDQDTGQLVPFMFRPVQAKYYETLCKEYDIERKGIAAPVREDILKARKEGYTSFILGLFAADDILSENPTQSEVISYKEDATKQFRVRYRRYILSYFARKYGAAVEDIQRDINVLEQFTKSAFAVDSQADGNYTLRHNGAHFYCGTARATTGERGGTLHKLLLSEHHHYQDTQKITAKEIIVGTAEQVSLNSGWVFRESTGGQEGGFTYKGFWDAYEGRSRYRGRFFGWQAHYTKEQFELIASGFTDKRILQQEYPENPHEAFMASGSSYFDNERIAKLLEYPLKPIERVNVYGDVEAVKEARKENKSYRNLITVTPTEEGELWLYERYDPTTTYLAGGDVAEGLPHGDFSVLRVLNVKTGRLAAKLKLRVPPDEFSDKCYLVGLLYGKATLAIEVNKDGLWVNRHLLKLNYPNIYFQERYDKVSKTRTKRFGWRTTESTRPLVLAELQKQIHQRNDWDEGLLSECKVFVRNAAGRPEAMTDENDDEIMAEAIARKVLETVPVPRVQKEEDLTPEEMRKKEVADAIQRKNSGETGSEYQEDYTNL